MRVFVMAARHWDGTWCPGLVAAGHQVTATTRSAAKTAQLREAGAVRVVVGGLDRPAVIAAAPEVIVHQVTVLADRRSLRNFDRVSDGVPGVARGALRTRSDGFGFRQRDAK